MTRDGRRSCTILRALADEAMLDDVKPFPRPDDQGPSA
jgi:hypothetical protein